MNWTTIHLETMKKHVLDWNGATPWCPSLHLAGDDRFDIYYAPFEYVNPRARLVIAGITPGVTQAGNALKEAQTQLRLGESVEVASARAKAVAAFSGRMHTNLVDLLDHIGVPGALGLSDASALFDSAAGLVQLTSVLRFPVLERETMLSNAEVALKSDLLRGLMRLFADECRLLPDALYLPLGRGVEKVLLHLAREGVLRRDRILAGMPHPSGANAERIAYFLGRKARSDLSAKTNPDKLDQVRTQLIEQVAAMRT